MHMSCAVLFFFNATATTEIYTLSLHDALPIWVVLDRLDDRGDAVVGVALEVDDPVQPLVAAAAVLSGDDAVVVPADRKSTRLNSSHSNISYAVFCLTKTNMPACWRTSAFQVAL